VDVTGSCAAAIEGSPRYLGQKANRERSEGCSQSAIASATPVTLLFGKRVSSEAIGEAKFNCESKVVVNRPSRNGDGSSRQHFRAKRSSLQWHQKPDG
jgi:hypothetical protein